MLKNLRCDPGPGVTSSACTEQQKLLLPSSEEKFVSLPLCLSNCKMETTRTCKVAEGKSVPDDLPYLIPLHRTGDGKERIHCCGRCTLFLGRGWAPTIHHIISLTYFHLYIIPHWDFKPRCCQDFQEEEEDGIDAK